MQGLESGAGLAGFGFWMFLADVVVGGIWYGIRERQAQHKTLRRMIEGGRPIDQALMERLMPTGRGLGQRLELDLKVAGWIVLFLAPGVALQGWLIGKSSAQWFFPLLGVAALVACVGVGLLVASRVSGHWEEAHPGAVSNHTLSHDTVSHRA